MNDSEAKSGTGKYKKSKKHKENLSKALKEYWSDEDRHDEWTEKIQEGIEEYWSEKPQEEYVLGKRYRQKFHGERDKIGYRLYQRCLSKEMEREPPSLLCVFEAKERRKDQFEL